MNPLPTYPKEMGSKSSSSLSKKIILWVKLFFKVFENNFKKGKEASRHGRK